MQIKYNVLSNSWKWEAARWLQKPTLLLRQPKAITTILKKKKKGEHLYMYITTKVASSDWNTRNGRYIKYQSTRLYNNTVHNQKY